MYICGKNVAKEYLLGTDPVKEILVQENFSDYDLLFSTINTCFFNYISIIIYGYYVNV